VALALGALGEDWRQCSSAAIVAKLNRDSDTRAAWDAVLEAVHPVDWPALAAALELLLPGLSGRPDLLSPASPFGHWIAQGCRKETILRLLSPERIAVLTEITAPADARAAA